MSEIKLDDVKSKKELDSILFDSEGKSTAIILPCLNCKTKWIYSNESLVGQGVLNCFCDSECEDRFALRQ